MLMLEVYFDETGHGDDPNIDFLGMAGCLEKAESWAVFEVEWDAVLKKEGLPYFHMKEFAHSKKIFKDWEGDNPRRDKLYEDLWKIIHKFEPVIVGCFVDLRGYRGRLGKGLRNIIGDAYHLCFFHCVKVISALVVNDYQSNVPIGNFATIFDDKKGFKGKAMTLYEDIIKRYDGLEETIPPPIFRDMRQVSPIQVADIFAYEAQKEFKEREKGIGRAKTRPGFEHLESLYLRQTNRNDYPFGHTSSQFAFYSQQELARITVAYNNHFGNKELQ